MAVLRPGRRTTVVIVGALLVAEGLVAIRIGYPSFDFRNALAVLATGLVVGAAGLTAWFRVPTSRVGVLLIVTAIAWYVGGFRWVAFEPLAEAAAGLDLVFAAVASHAIMTYPSGRARTSATYVAVAAVYVASIMPVSRADVLVAMILMLAIALQWWRRPGYRRERMPATLTGMTLALVLGAYVAVPSLVSGLGWLDTRPLLQIALIAVAVALTRSLIRASGAADRTADIVTELATDPGADLVRQLGGLLGDPQARLGFWDAHRGRYVNAHGRPVEFSTEVGRSVTVIADDGRSIAAIEHDGAAQLDDGTRAALLRALEGAAANARLQAEVRAQLMEASASRRRLLQAGEDERLRLERELFVRLDPQLDALQEALTDPRLAGEDAVGAVLAQVDETRAEITSLVRGWGPPDLDDRGIVPALRDIAARAKIPVELRLDDVEVSQRLTRSTLLFVVSEALANVAKHAGASAVTVHLQRTSDAVALVVEDDGRGGADATRGTGLQGLRDRVEAIGGRLSIDSRPGHGTRLQVAVPIGEPAA